GARQTSELEPTSRVVADRAPDQRFLENRVDQHALIRGFNVQRSMAEARDPHEATPNARLARLPERALGDALLVPKPGANVGMSRAREVLCFVEGRGLALDGADPDLTRDLLAAADGRTKGSSIVERLAPRHGAERVSAVISALVEVGALGELEVTAPDERRVVILGNHELARALDGALEQGGYLRRTRVHVKSFERLADPAFRGRLLLPLPELSAPEADRTLENANVEALTALLGEFDLAVAALEGLPNHALLEVNRAALAAGVPCWFVTPEAIGPLS